MALFKAHKFGGTNTWTVPAGGIQVHHIYSVDDDDVIKDWNEHGYTEVGSVRSLKSGFKTFVVRDGDHVPGGHQLIYTPKDSDADLIIEYFELT